MEINNVIFLGSFPREELCPKGGKPEFAFIGRSNVGKSSLINMLCANKGIAKTSKQPGKTQAINMFEVDQKWCLVDLPGYGYAKISKKQRQLWERMIHYYLRERDALQCAFVLLDSRHDLQQIDREFLQWCGAQGIPIALVYTKVDKVKSGDVNENVLAIETSLMEDWEMLPSRFTTSAEKHLGRTEILDFIGDIVNNF